MCSTHRERCERSEGSLCLETNGQERRLIINMWLWAARTSSYGSAENITSGKAFAIGNAAGTISRWVYVLVYPHFLCFYWGVPSREVLAALVT